MQKIIEATERNERLKAGPDGECLLRLTTRAKSNLNVDLAHLDEELQRQFGLYSVEVTGDGVSLFHVILIETFTICLFLGMCFSSNTHFRYIIHFVARMIFI